MIGLIDPNTLEKAIYEWMPKDQETWMESDIPPIENLVVSIMMTIQEQPIIDAIPVEFIQELIKQDKQYIEEYGGYTDYDEIVDGLIERAFNYEALIEKWREKNGTETD